MVKQTLNTFYLKLKFKKKEIMTFIIAFKTIKYLRINLAEDAQDLYPEKYLKKKHCWEK